MANHQASAPAINAPPAEAPPPAPLAAASPRPAAPSDGTAAGRGGARLDYNPALDGIRGLAVAAVLLFHGGVSWAQGGYLGVSTFFTLSGFLITSLLVTEHQRTGRIDLRRFWARRMRRLLPAALVTLAAVMLAVVLVDEGWERNLPGDVLASALHVANWRFLIDNRAYADLFELPSPVLHFWSLAIEEQFYWLFPLVAAGVLALTKGSLRAFVGVLGGLIALSAALTFLYRDSPETVYYATPIRMGEILIGAVLALMVIGRGDGSPPGVRTARLGSGLGLAALAVSLVAWWQVDQGSAWVSNGGLLAYAVASGLLIWGACLPGPLRRALSIEPLRKLGVVSYGVYLIHWPVFLLLTEPQADRVLRPLNIEPRGATLLSLRIGVTLILAVLSYRLIEMPIRHGRRPRRVRGSVVAAGAMAVVLLLVIVMPRISPPPSDQFAEAEYLARMEGPAPEELAPDNAVGITLGDSTMMVTGLGLSEWGHETRRLVLASGAGGLGCSIGRGGEVIYGGREGDIRDDCDWEPALPDRVAHARERYGDLVRFGVIQTGPWDVADRRLEGDDQWRHIGDPVYDTFLAGELAAATDQMLAEGLTVVWLTAPDIETGRNREPPPSTPFPESDPERMDRLNQMIHDLAASRDGVVVVDLAGWLSSLPEDEQERLRPDGVHFTSEEEEHTALEVAERWLAEAVLDAIEEGERQIAGHGPEQDAP